MEQVKQIVYTLLRVFIGALLGFVIASGLNVVDMSWVDWKPAIGAAIAAVLVAAFNFINPKDGRYGIGAGK